MVQKFYTIKCSKMVTYEPAAASAASAAAAAAATIATAASIPTMHQYCHKQSTKPALVSQQLFSPLTM